MPSCSHPGSSFPKEGSARVGLLWSSKVYLGEISYHVATAVVTLAQDVEQERFHIIVQCLVIQEQLGQQAEVLTVNLVLLSVHFEDRDRIQPVNLVSWRMAQVALELAESLLRIGLLILWGGVTLCLSSVFFFFM